MMSLCFCVNVLRSYFCTDVLFPVVQCCIILCYAVYFLSHSNTVSLSYLLTLFCLHLYSDIIVNEIFSSFYHQQDLVFTLNIEQLFC